MKPWRVVEFRLSGLKGASLFATNKLLVTDATGHCEPALAMHAGSSTEHAIYTLRVAPGRWVVAPQPGSPVTFTPLAFDVDSRAATDGATVVEIDAWVRQ